MESVVKLSDGEKLILVGLCDLLLDRDETQKSPSFSFDPGFVQIAIMGGHSWALNEVLNNFEKEDDIDVVNDIFYILHMWWIIEGASSDFSVRQKEELKSIARRLSLGISFEGFHKSIEPDYYYLTKFIVEETDRFTAFRDRELDAYMEMFPIYERMLFNFKKVEERKYELTFDEIAALFKIDN